MTLSLEEICGPARMGDLDGINPPWFPMADAALLFWQIHRESVELLLRMRHGQGRVEIWPATALWVRLLISHLSRHTTVRITFCLLKLFST